MAFQQETICCVQPAPSLWASAAVAATAADTAATADNTHYPQSQTCAYHGNRCDGRTPCAVLCAQIGRHDNVVQAISAARRPGGGSGGLFRGTTALLAREVPFYVCGLMAYTQLKSVFNGACILTAWCAGRSGVSWVHAAASGVAGLALLQLRTM